jgi:hypothetical protein
MDSSPAINSLRSKAGQQVAGAIAVLLVVE